MLLTVPPIGANQESDAEGGSNMTTVSSLTANCGMRTSPGPSPSAARILRKVPSALYHAIRAGECSETRMPPSDLTTMLVTFPSAPGDCSGGRTTVTLSSQVL